MASIDKGRYTNNQEREEVVVFLIGMHIKKWWAVHKWLPVLLAMPPMLKELSEHEELGCLAFENFWRFRTTLSVQYWRSEEELLAYSRSEKHLKAWQRFNRKARNNTSVGIYHENYIVTEGNFESAYVNMPRFGLGKAVGKQPMNNDTATAKQRIRL
ncbi:hypothetical protein J2R98_002108 [Alkalibacillus filiformis]|uniref:DUF4188 domain-containing protein n=1 Tax=Alkalibacillus filiformis TaxID=200990 RepID=A0ABU0DUZ2_9BACI|nr:DUF4188 domain-containing protein [Alkalibacillus filiformis]MDQ0352274.1 hypothetical protein [Alkalibacillus filiformis]